MAFLNKNQIKETVNTALKNVADFTGEIDNYEFKNFHEFHKNVFINKLKELINSGPYYDRAGNIEYERYYDVPLSIQIFNTWVTINDCIQFIYNNQIVKMRNPNKIQLS
ncbi:MAG: hypothetical protein HXX18_11245 [Bacteroidetes bacterium]|nr:hypothetical protein [Bacteroidota bacterium]